MRPRTGLEIQGRYQLAERIALGGMGEVWRATDLRSGRAVAVKILRPELQGDEIFLSRLRAEAKNASGLRHPNLAVVLDAGERQGSGWIVMELVQGRPLSDILAERGTMPPEEILTILAQVARALQVVHDAGVVHRDVKPSNILITQEGLAKLTDFGISTGTNQLPMTAAGMVMGTAQYLAPEQAMGNLATPAGDLYSLGIIAYEALTGNRPFAGASQVDIAYQHVNTPVPPLPESLPAQVRQVVMELLAKRPAERPFSARELARRLDRIVIRMPQEDWDPKEGVQWRGPASVRAAELEAGAQADTPATPSSPQSATEGQNAAPEEAPGPGSAPGQVAAFAAAKGARGSAERRGTDRRAAVRAATGAGPAGSVASGAAGVAATGLGTPAAVGTRAAAARVRPRNKPPFPVTPGAELSTPSPAGTAARRHGRSEQVLVYTLLVATLFVLVAVLALLGMLLSGSGAAAAQGQVPVGAVSVIPAKEAQ
ncbi:Serine/threonine-protein kinase PrkC [Actinomyces bovis]|uniref:non-specific serine/threonine protein kinase n=1 Tax=Actinomyces bovis TaxID=1658 RepID=A0ABY1VRB9_9ACTO|nr:serine/threonine-protein kinase [Actinomyces bovis]SPT54383.1 Serine/threonine-protein kinase PrkC [Actinomyces bovis]VEG56069.1 Serine/threonine-protein kinase PrkC [Actinomyces israelii]